MKSTKYTRSIVYLGIAVFIVSIVTNFIGILSYELFEFFHLIMFIIALYYLVWHFLITKGHKASYDRISEGTILLMIIYNPFKPFILEVAVWMFLDFIFLWVFLLYLAELRGMEKNIKNGVINWSNTGEDLP